MKNDRLFEEWWGSEWTEDRENVRDKYVAACAWDAACLFILEDLYSRIPVGGSFHRAYLRLKDELENPNAEAQRIRIEAKGIRS